MAAQDGAGLRCRRVTLTLDEAVRVIRRVRIERRVSVLGTLVDDGRDHPRELIGLLGETSSIAVATGRQCPAVFAFDLLQLRVTVVWVAADAGAGR